MGLAAASLAGAAVIGACALGTAAPAHATTEPATSSTQVTIGSTVGLFTTPRLNTPTRGQLYAGDQVRAYCAFVNDGTAWVKIHLDEETRFVQRSGVAQGAESLPSICPNEVETVERVALTMKFGSPAWGVPIEAFTCPASYPYLDARIEPIEWKAYLPYHDSPTNDDERYWGLRLERSVGIGVALGGPVSTTGPDGTKYLSGFMAGNVSNHFAWDSSITMTASCTNNLAYAKKWA
jgi:hypothetical protein